jgi:hypothetical protein
MPPIIAFFQLCYNGFAMKKRRSAGRSRNAASQKPLEWLPIDSRILPDILRFGRLSGAAKLFLTIEILFSTIVVLSTLCLVFLHCFSK